MDEKVEELTKKGLDVEMTTTEIDKKTGKLDLVYDVKKDGEKIGSGSYEGDPEFIHKVVNRLNEMKTAEQVALEIKLGMEELLAKI